MLQEKIERIYSDFIGKRTYTRWIEEEGKRESWIGAVERYGSYYGKYVPEAIRSDYASAIEFKKSKEVMGSMRALWSAGPALEENSFASFNCAFIFMDEVVKFGELLYILMHGTGCGISVERQYVTKLPVLPETFVDSDFVWVVQDSKLGWKEAFDYCISSLYLGVIPKFDFSQVRPKGARLKTFGGRASGPEPLKALFAFCSKVFQGAKNRKLNSLEVHDICCKIADIVVCGGVRRSALVSFSNLSDQRMKHAKDGSFYLEHPYRMMANNSVAYTERPEPSFFLEEWLNLMKSGSGERGIFNASAARKKADRLGRLAGDIRANPCVEALLRDRQLCNLTEVIIRSDDTVETLKQKIRAAVLLGCIQAMETNFNNVSPIWKQNAIDETLLGVSLTGICDNMLFKKVCDKTRKTIRELKQYADECAIEFSGILGIKKPAQVTLTKPSGTVSELCGTSSGIHPRYSDYYIRRVRVNSKDPIAKLLLDKGVPCNPEVGQTWDDCNTVVFEFPMKSPRGSLNRDDFDAISQLEYWKMFYKEWCDGNPSATIYVKEDEWVAVGAWVYDNWDDICGLSFLPFDDSVYQLTPFEQISREQYHELCKFYSKVDIDFDHELNSYEKEDTTEGAKTMACTAGACEMK